MTMTRFARIRTSLGTLLLIAADDALTGLHFVNGKHVPAIDPAWLDEPGHPLFTHCAAQVEEYLAGERGKFDLPLAPKGTAFQQRVWREIAKVPFGETITYSQLAARAGAPGSARAAGAATGRNPISLVIPCHRIVATDGSLTGYAGGLARKEKLLALEGALEETAA
jgi:methylated-DNA-[protein]-cysteine S-methyltransferase